MKTQTTQFLKRRKFLLVLPLLVLPFVTMAFWALGGGKGQGPAVPEQQGLNATVPVAKLQEQPLDKMSLYNQAAKDSMALRDQARMDPFAEQQAAHPMGGQVYETGDMSIYQDRAYGGYQPGGDNNEARLSIRLAELERSLSQPGYAPVEAPQPPASNGNLERLENMMQSMGQAGESDPEMKQLDGMLEKLVDIQNPERVQERLRQQSEKNRGRTYAVSKQQRDTRTDLLSPAPAVPATSDSGSANAFYGLEQQPTAADTILQTAISAVVSETQTLVSGAAIKLKLGEAVFINGAMIPAGTFISGICAINGERLTIEIANIRYGKSLYPVGLSAYDPDGIEGIRIPGAISRDAAKDGADRTIQSMQLMSLDPSIGAQAASAGVEAAKGLFSKKAKLIRVTVKAGHPVLLVDLKARQALN